MSNPPAAQPEIPPQLEYAGFADSRPGLVTAIGVISIVVAGFSVLAALYSGLMLVPMLMMAGGGFGPGGPGGGTPTAVTAAGSLKTADADAIVAALNAQAAMPPADQKTLAAALVAMEVPLAPPADGNWTAAHVNGQIGGYSVTSFGTGSYTSYTLNSGGTLQVNAGTATFSYFDSAGGWTSATYGPGGAVSTNTMATGGPFGGGVSTLSVAVQVASFVLSLALAGLLLAAGVQMVRGRPSGRTLHLWWAWPKLAAAALASASWVLWIGNFSQGIGGGVGMWDGAWIVAGVVFVMAVAWPITVLFLLRARRVRAYFADA